MLQTDAADVAESREGCHGKQMLSGKKMVHRLYPKILVTFAVKTLTLLIPQMQPARSYK